MPRITLLFLFALTAATAQAQVASPEAVALLTRWSAETRAAYALVERVDYVETLDQRVDGPFNRHHLQSIADVTIRPDRDRPDRRFREVAIDGRPVLPARARFAQNRLRRALGPGFEAVVRATGLPLRVLGSLRPVGDLTPTDLDGVPALRVEAVARDERGPVERATLWFGRVRTDQDTPILLRSQIILRPEAARAQPIVVSTDYETYAGVPIPRRRRVEASLQQRRRIRTFTVLVTADVAIDEIRVTPR